MFKSVTIEPRPNNERHHWVVRCRVNDTVDHEKQCVSLEDAFVEAQAWLLHGDMLKRADRDSQERDRQRERKLSLMAEMGILPVKEIP